MAETVCQVVTGAVLLVVVWGLCILVGHGVYWGYQQVATAVARTNEGGKDA